VWQASIDGGDAFGREMNFAAIVMNQSKSSGVIVSSRVKSDVDHRKEEWSRKLHWTELPNVTLKGFSDPQTLWGVDASA
jgi:class 3 adenylate cyclase